MTDLTDIMAAKKKETKTEEAPADAPQMSKEEEIGYHKGSLSTLVNERNELIKMAQVTEQIMQAHIKRLEELGVKLETGQK